MKASLVQKLCCPFDKNDLDIRIFTQREEEGSETEILEALLTCKACKRYYPVIYGIPVMTPDEFREKALENPLLQRWGVALEGSPAEPFILDSGRKPGS
jgi:uncharacterized protein